MANGITLKADSGPYIVTTAPSSFFTDAGLSSAVTAPVTITSDTVWYCSAATAAATPDVSLVCKQLDGTTIFSGTIRVGQTTDTYLRPEPTGGQAGADLSRVLYRYDEPATGFATFPRVAAATTVSMTSQALRCVAFTAPQQMTVGSVKVYVGSTAAAATPTVVRIGLYAYEVNGDATLVASTANDTTLLAATNTAYTKALSASYALTAGTRYAVGLLVVTGATAPSIAAANLGSTALSSSSPKNAWAQTGQADLPASVVAANQAATASVPYFELVPA